MKKLENSGFTLVELVAIIVILAAIFLVAVPTIISTSKDAKNKEYDLMVDILCEAGKSYVYTNDEFELNNNDKTVLYVSELVENNLVDSNMKNPLNNELVNNDVLLLNVKDDSSLDCTYKKYSDYVSRLILNLNGGSYNGLTTITQEPGTVYSVQNNPTREGYVFGGWKLTSGDGDITWYDESDLLRRYKITSTSSTQPAVYNNNSNGAVTHTIIPDSTSETGYSLKITTNGTANPGAGGFVNSTMASSGSVFYHEFIAKVPVGYTLTIASNSRGAGSSQYWLTPNVGTGNWETYIYITACGYNGTFSTFGHVYLTGSNNTNVTWYLQESSMYQISNSKASTEATSTIFKFKASDATLTAQWNTTGVGVTYDRQGGSFGNGTIGTKWTKGSDNFIYNTAYTNSKVAPYYISSSDFAIYKDGYTFNGWYTAATGGVQVFDATGKLKANVPGYSDANSKWIKYDSNVTLYARWIPISYSLIYSLDGGTATNPTSYNIETSTFILNNPTKTVTITGNDNGTGATIGSATSKAQTFVGWSGTNLTGTSNKTVTILLGSSGNRSYTANWTAVSLATPTIIKDGYVCGWATSSTATSYTIASGGTYTPSATSNSNITLYAVCVLNMASGINLLKNGDFQSTSESTSMPTKTANGVTHTWDNSLNGIPGSTNKLYSPSNWANGGNMGVSVPEIGYHAHIIKTGNNYVVDYKTNEDYNGMTQADLPGGVSVTPGTITTSRWLGVSQSIPEGTLLPGHTYTFSVDLYRVSGVNVATGGLLYHTTSNSTNSFGQGQYNFNPTKTGEWERFTWTFTLPSDFTGSSSFYIYGNGGGIGEFYADNAVLEEVQA